LYERINMPQYALTVLNTIATIYNRMGEHEQAAQIYERARSQQHDAGLRRDEAVTLYNLGRARLKLGEWDAARAGYSGCLALSRELKYARGEAYALLGLASVDNATGDPNGALGKLDRGIELQRQSPDARLDAQIQLARGTALRQLQRGAEALSALKQSEAVFKQADSLEELGTTYGELATAYAQTGDWRSAYNYRADAQTTSEKLLHNQLDQRFATLKVEFDTAAKEKENTLLLSQNALDRKALAQERRANALRSQLTQRLLAADRLDRHPRFELRAVLFSRRRHRPLLCQRLRRDFNLLPGLKSWDHYITTLRPFRSSTTTTWDSKASSTAGTGPLICTTLPVDTGSIRVRVCCPTCTTSR
jgi:tetratricopeptide (TPR) repeat protein